MTQYRGEVYFDDSPPCLQFGTESVSSATVWNMCDVDVIVTQVVGVQKASGDDETTYVIQPENGASIDLPDDQADLKWSLADGRSGTLRVEFYPYEPGPRCTTYGCDTMVSHSTPIPSLLLIFIAASASYGAAYES